MTRPLISVIIPVYNVKNYLEQCLDSITHQTLTDVEIICINDASEDNSDKILEKHKKRDNRIKIINQKHLGVSSARNMGLKNAKGEFISFIDADDWIEFNMLEKLHDKIEKLQADFIISNILYYTERNNAFIKDKETDLKNYFDKTFDERTFSYKDVKNFIMKIPTDVGAKLYRNDFLRKTKSKFKEGMIFEDGPFFFDAFFKAEKVTVLKEFLYVKRIDRANSVLNMHSKKHFDTIDAANLMFKALYKTTIFEEIKYDFYIKKLKDLLYFFHRIPGLEQDERELYASKFKAVSVLLNEKYFDYNFIMIKFPQEYNDLNEMLANSKSDYERYYKLKHYIIRTVFP